MEKNLGKLFYKENQYTDNKIEGEVIGLTATIPFIFYY